MSAPTFRTLIIFKICYGLENRFYGQETCSICTSYQLRIQFLTGLV